MDLYIEKQIDKKLYSQYKEDKIYFNLFFSKPKIRTNGFFVELGALDGKFSNTLFFEKELGWRGILIEVLPSNCKKLLNRGRISSGNNITKSLINVTCTNINDMLHNAGITHIDFFFHWMLKEENIWF